MKMQDMAVTSNEHNASSPTTQKNPKGPPNNMHDVQSPDTVLETEIEKELLVSAKNVTNRPRFAVIKEHLYSDLQGEAVILSMKNGKYYGVNGVGRSIWKSLLEPLCLDEICGLVMREYEVDDEMCRREVLLFLQRMLAEGLIEIRDGNGP